MSEYYFGLGRGRLDTAEVARREAIAERHGCTFVHTQLPGEGWRSWYAGPNRGEPFDRQLAADVLGEVCS